MAGKGHPLEPSETGLGAVGEAISSALESETDARAQIAAGRVRLLQNVTHAGIPQRRAVLSWFAVPSWAARVAVVGVALSSVAGAIAWSLQPAALSFEIGENGTLGREADLVEAPGSAPVALRFSEGSVMDLQPLARARVLSSAPEGARVLLERGAAEVSVVHKLGQPTSWAFEAGPFVVAVTGTRFGLAWHPETQRMTLAMTEGSVRLSAPCLPTPRTVVKGEQIELSCLAGSLEQVGRSDSAFEGPRVAAAAPAASILGEPGPLQAEAQPSLALTAASRLHAVNPPVTEASMGLAGRGGNVAVPPQQSEPPQSGAAQSWQELLARRDWSAAVREAERLDFGAVCQSASLTELDRLANAARLAGRGDRAIKALSTLRQRFPGSNEAATAAFSLGRMAFDQRADYKSAVNWFGAYLRERPRGPLMGDAMGRLMEARDRAGDDAAARRDARHYLDRFPHGPYARAATAILAE